MTIDTKKIKAYAPVVIIYILYKVDNPFLIMVQFMLHDSKIMPVQKYYQNKSAGLK